MFLWWKLLPFSGAVQKPGHFSFPLSLIFSTSCCYWFYFLNVTLMPLSFLAQSPFSESEIIIAFHLDDNNTLLIDLVDWSVAPLHNSAELIINLCFGATFNRSQGLVLALCSGKPGKTWKTIYGPNLIWLIRGKSLTSYTVTLAPLFFYSLFSIGLQCLLMKVQIFSNNV